MGRSDDYNCVHSQLINVILCCNRYYTALTLHSIGLVEIQFHFVSKLSLAGEEVVELLQHPRALLVPPQGVYETQSPHVGLLVGGAEE